jgi:hypothetical protein
LVACSSDDSSDSSTDTPIGGGGDGSSGGGSGSDDPSNAEPVADAGDDQVVDSASSVSLSASASDDKEGFSVSWRQTAGPVVSLNNADTLTPSFTAPTIDILDDDNKLAFQLVVEDSDGANAIDSLEITVKRPSSSKQIFVNSASGDDGNSGSVDAPLATISQCITNASPGSICEIAPGNYRSSISINNSGTQADPIVICGDPDDFPVISGFDQLIENQDGAGAWQEHSADIWKIQLDSNWHHQIFGGDVYDAEALVLLIDGVRQNQARWPNTDKSSNYARGEDFAISTAGGLGDKVVPGDDSDRNYNGFYEASGLADYWVGGYVQFSAGHEWWGEAGIVTASSPGRVDFQFDTQAEWTLVYKTPTYDDPFFLWGRLEALDHEKEFYFDVNGDYGSAYTLYVYGDPRGKNIEWRRRDDLINLANQSHIHFKHLRFVGGNIDTKDTTEGIIFDNIECRLCGRDRLSNGWAKQAIMLRGNDSQIINSLLYELPTITISVNAADDVIISNNVIHNAGYVMSSSDGIQTPSQPNRPLITHNTIYDTSHLGISVATAQQGNVRHNRVYNIAKQKTDTSGINVWNGGNSNGTEISYNLVHDVIGYSTGKDEVNGVTHFGGKGIRLDAGDAPAGNFNYKIHHNIIYNTSSNSMSIHGNSDSQRLAAGLVAGQDSGNEIFNNTVDGILFVVERENVDHKGSAYKNNIIGDNFWLGGVSVAPDDAVVSHNIIQTNGNSIATDNLQVDPLWVDPENGDFRLQSGSPAIDAGTEVAPFTNGFAGNAPDIGALEYGQPIFSAGATITYEQLFNIEITCTQDGTIACTLTNFPVGRVIPNEFTIRIGNLSNQNCEYDYDPTQHITTEASCSIDPEGASGAVGVQLSLDGVNFVATDQWFELP